MHWKYDYIVRFLCAELFGVCLQCVVAAEQLSSSVVQVSVWHSRGLKRKLFLGETLVRLADLCLESTDTQRSVCYALGPKVRSVKLDWPH